MAAAAWDELQNLFFTTWAAYFILQDHLQDPEPIHFLLEKTSEEVYTPKLKETFKVARGGWTGGPKPIYYKSGQRPCRTVGEALKAILYNEPTWKQDFAGDWNLWWRQNQAYYRK